MFKLVNLRDEHDINLLTPADLADTESVYTDAAAG